MLLPVGGWGFGTGGRRRRRHAAGAASNRPWRPAASGRGSGRSAGACPRPPPMRLRPPARPAA